MKKILVATDFSKCAQAALDHAVKLSAATAGKITLLHTNHLPAYVMPDGSLFNLDAETARDLERGIDEHLENERKRAGGLMAVARIQGDAPQGIVSYATDGHFDLIVMGTHGRTGFKRLLLGSIAERVLRTAPCPVLVVREGA